MSNRPILSLCIPTYNRSGILEKTLQRIVDYKSFDEDVEIVISDNCSTDDTQKVGERFAAEYQNVHYYRNEENTLDRNFIQVMHLGQGDYLKLLNDWCFPTEKGLAEMKRVLKEYQSTGLPVFFTSGWARSKHAQLIRCQNLDEYVKEASVMVTFNNLFGAWRADWDGLKDKARCSQLKLLQVDWTYRIVCQKGALLYNGRTIDFAPEMQTSIRKGYNYFQVMFRNYYHIMQRFINEGHIQENTMEEDKKYFLKHFRPELFQALVYNSSPYWKYDTTGTWNLLYNDYKNKLYFYTYVLTLPLQWFLHASVRDFGKCK